MSGIYAFPDMTSDVASSDIASSAETPHGDGDGGGGGGGGGGGPERGLPREERTDERRGTLVTSSSATFRRPHPGAVENKITSTINQQCVGKTTVCVCVCVCVLCAFRLFFVLYRVTPGPAASL